MAHVEVMDTTGSTNAMALDDGREGLLLVAREQTDGVGRHGSRWVSPRGGLYMSYAPPLMHTPARPTDLSPLAAMAVAEAVEAVLGRAGRGDTRALIKWPNDVLVSDGKVAGVLLRSRSGSPDNPPPRTVVGIGVNVNAIVVIDPPEIRPADEWPVVPRSLAQLAGSPLSLLEVAIEVMEGLLTRLEAGLDGVAMGQYRSRCLTLGKRVSYFDGERRFVGTARDLSPDGGALLVALPDGTVREVSAGEVRHVRAVLG